METAIIICAIGFGIFCTLAGAALFMAASQGRWPIDRRSETRRVS